MQNDYDAKEKVYIIFFLNMLLNNWIIKLLNY